MHHHQPVTVRYGLLHRVRDHHRGKTVARDDAVGDAHDLVGAARIERGGVLVKEQELRAQRRGHQQRERLALSAREAADRIVETPFQPHAELFDARLDAFARTAGQQATDAAAQTAPLRKRQVLRHRQVGRRAAERVLEYAADQCGATVLGPGCEVGFAQADDTGIDEKGPRHRVQQGRFSGAVGADHHHERTVVDRQVHVAQRSHLVHGAGMEGLGDALYLKHGRRLRQDARAACRHSRVPPAQSARKAPSPA